MDAPSPTASTGARIPRRLQPGSRSAHDSEDSRNPSASAISSCPRHDPQHHKQAHLVLLSRRTLMWIRPPSGARSRVLQRPFAERRGVVSRLRGAPGDRRRRTGRPRGRGTAPTRARSRLCAIKDVFSNRIVGYSIDSRMKSRLAVAALTNAVARRRIHRRRHSPHHRSDGNLQLQRPLGHRHRAGSQRGVLRPR
jgi:hypothetical protein